MPNHYWCQYYLIVTKTLGNKLQWNQNQNIPNKISKKRKCCLGLNVLRFDDVIKWKHFPPYWPFVQGIHRSPVNSPHKGQWWGALMFSLICAMHHAHYDVIVMGYFIVTGALTHLKIGHFLWHNRPWSQCCGCFSCTRPSASPILTNNWLCSMVSSCSWDGTRDNLPHS